MGPGGLFSHWRSRRALQLIRAECSLNGSWRSHPALAGSSRTPASVAWGARIRELLNDIFLVSSVSVVANGQRERLLRGAPFPLSCRHHGGRLRCARPVLFACLHSTSTHRLFSGKYSVVLYLLHGRIAARLFFFLVTSPLSLRVQVFLEIFYWLSLKFFKAPGPLWGVEGRWP